MDVNLVLPWSEKSRQARVGHRRVAEQGRRGHGRPASRTLPGVRTTAAAVLFALVAMSCSTTDTAAPTDTSPPPVEVATPETAPPAPGYPSFDDIDPYLHPYFIALEGTGLAAQEGEQRLWGLGVGVCRNLDGGNTVAEEVEGLAVDAALGDPAGSVVGSAALSICDHHLPAVQAWAEDPYPASE